MNRFSLNIPVLCTVDLYDKQLATNIMVLRTFAYEELLLAIIIRVLHTFGFKAAEPQKICRNAFEKQNHRCRAP
jgi:hypothetical protein